MSAAMYLPGLESAELRRDLSAFFTPAWLATRIWDWSGAARSSVPLRVLEPSAGLGALIKPIFELRIPVRLLTVCDADPSNVEALKRLLDGAPFETRIICGDFHAADVGPHDICVNNTPFDDDQDIRFAEKVTKLCSTTFGVYPARMRFSAGRREFWQWTDIRREAVLCERPQFGGHTTGATDFNIWELHRRRTRRQPGEPCTTNIEWW